MKSPNSEDPHYTVLLMLMFPLSQVHVFSTVCCLIHPDIWSQNWVCIGNRLGDRNCGAISGRGGEFLFSLKAFRPTVEPTQPPTQWLFP
jgi:hypothetical protein